MASNKKLNLKNVFLSEGAVSQHYGLDPQTPSNVYVPDTTQNRVITMRAEDPIDEEDMHECGCGEPSGPHIHRVGAPGGPDLNSGHNAPEHVLFDTETDVYHNEAAPGADPDPAQVVLHDDGPKDKRHDDREPPEAMMDYEGEEEHYRQVADYHDSDQRYNNDWKPRHPRRESKFSESFGDFAGEEELEIG